MSGEQGSEGTLLGQYAGFVTRLSAFVIDRLILAGIITLITMVAQFVYGALRVSQWFGTQQLAQTVMTVVTVSVLVVVFLAYDMGFWLLAGQTPGKRIMGVRIVCTDGDRVHLGNAIRREIGYLISATLFLGYLWVLFDNRRQAWHDKLAGTLVVYSWPEQGGTPIQDRFGRFRRWRGQSQGTAD
jgi:uncharacterized RDD family membrane protein YckC